MSVDRANERGAAAVEFALVTPILFLLVFGIIDFGRMWNMQIALSQAAREGVRILALGGTADQAEARTTAAATPVTGLTITETTCPGTPSPADDARLTVTRQFDYLTPVGALAGLFGGSLDAPVISGVGRMRCHG